MFSTQLDRRQFLRISGLTAAGIASAGALAACTSAGSVGAPLQDWLAFDSVAQGNWYRQNIIDVYNKTNKPIVDLVVKEQQTIDQNIQVALSAGHAPDLVRSGGAPFVITYANAGYLARLDSYASKYHWDTAFQKWAIQSSLDSKGRLYGMPTSYDSVVLFYNPETFKKHGWSVPKNKEQFESIMSDAKSKGMLPLGATNNAKPVATGWYASALLNAIVGPQNMYDALTGKIPWTSTVFVDAVKQIQGYVDQGWLGGGAQSYATLTFADLYSKLASGDAAMVLMLSWGFSTLPPYFGKAAGNSATYEWAAVPPLSPGVPEDLYILAIGSSVSINSKSKDPDAAAEFLNWSFDPKRQMAALADVDMGPSPVVLDTAAMPSNMNKQIASYYQALSNAKTVGYGSWCSFPPNCATYMYTEMEKVFFGKTTPTEFWSGFQSEFTKQRNAGLVPPVASPTLAS